MANICVKIPIRSYILHRPFHTTAAVNTQRQIRNVINKLFKAPKKKKYYADFPVMPSPVTFSKGSYDGKPSGNSRRATVLNKLFMRHITDQMAMGEYSNEILGHGIEIDRVKMSGDYKILNVYWLARGTADDEQVETILKKTAGFLRHELSQLRVMGNVPTINFVKDKHYAHLTELDNRLKVADFGEDYVLTDPSENLKTELELCAPLDEDIKVRIAKLELEHLKDDTDELPLPPMPQNIFGLNHADIMNRVQKKVKNLGALHKHNSAGLIEESWAQFKVNQTVNTDPVSFGSEKSQREVFKEFLHKRQLLREKARRNKNYVPDTEYIKEELLERQMDSTENINIWENETEDYLDDEVDEPRRY